MSGTASVKKSRFDSGKRRTILGVIIIAALLIDAIAVGILIGAKGIVPAMPAIAGGIVFVGLSALYWLRSEKHDTDGGDHSVDRSVHSLR